MTDPIPEAIQKKFVDLDQEIAALKSADSRLDAEIETLKKELATGFRTIEHNFERLHGRLDDALANTLRALPPWAAGIGGVMIALLAALITGIVTGGHF